MRIEFLLEEASMEEVLRNLLPKILPSEYKLDENCFLRPHQGRTDLQKSIPKKIKAFSSFYEPVKIVIVHDQHKHDCVDLKNRLLDLCKKDTGTFEEQEPGFPVLIRIVCKELESWYLGDLNAIQKAYPSFNAAKFKNKSQFKNPDILNASDMMMHILPEFQKVKTAKSVSPFLDVQNNNSRSFNVFINGVIKFLEN